MNYCYQQRGFFLRALLILVGGVLLFVWGYRTFLAPPASFPLNATVVVEKGDSLGTLAERLTTQGVIKSPQVFKLLMRALGSEGAISVGEYSFDRPMNAIDIALKISGKDFSILQNRVTIPEGFTRKDIAARLSAKFDEFDSNAFLSLTEHDEGYLFPDTYSFSLHPTPQEVQEVMKENFTKKTISLEPEFAASIRTKASIITMASIVEKEANGGEEMAIVAGILWKRIDRGIALQVDAPFLFLFGKTSAELTASDLATNSPYNTYRFKGLPPGPIGNPGIAAIEAALRPVESPYLYYLHDAKGQIHYASTYQEHLENKKKYLK